MILSLLFTAAPSLGSAALASFAPQAPAPAVQTDGAKEAEYKKRFETSKGDVTKLAELAKWCDENELRDQKREVLNRILELDPNNEEAHKALHHHAYDGKWFETYAELSSYKRDEAKRMLEEKGLVRYKDEWVPAADVTYLRMGWVKDESGKWVSKATLEQAKMEADLRSKGWKQQTDLVWVPPEEFHFWDEQKWKCGDQWLSIEDANKFHSVIGQWWSLPGQHFVVLSTCDYETAWQAANEADKTFEELVRFYGTQPSDKPQVVVLNSVDQYNAYAAGEQGVRPQTESGGYSSCHYAFFADLQFGGTPDAPEYKGGGVAYWNAKDQNLAPYGRHSVRHAAGQSFGEAIDPSFETVSKMIASPTAGMPEAEFWAEKRAPRWMRYGAASYVERYFEDPYEKDPWWARKWAIGNLLQKGDLDPFAKIFEFRLDPSDDTGRLISEAGLVVSFILDGKCPPVIGAHRKFKSLMRSGADTKEAVAELQKALEANREAFEAYVVTIQS